jgi:hypothetical protein
VVLLRRKRGKARPRRIAFDGQASANSQWLTATIMGSHGAQCLGGRSSRCVSPGIVCRQMPDHRQRLDPNHVAPTSPGSVPGAQDFQGSEPMPRATLACGAGPPPEPAPTAVPDVQVDTVPWCPGLPLWRAPGRSSTWSAVGVDGAPLAGRAGSAPGKRMAARVRSDVPRVR